MQACACARHFDLHPPSPLTNPHAGSAGTRINTGNGPTVQYLDIGHLDYGALIEPDAAFWSLVRKDQLAEVFDGGPLRRQLARKRQGFLDEIQTLRFGLKPIGVYVNPTDRCNLNCTYCYIPEAMRRDGQHMPARRLHAALAKLRDWFRDLHGQAFRPMIVFHGAEPLLNQEALFPAIATFAKDFRFGVQTNSTLLDDEAIAFFTRHDVGIGLSLDGAGKAVADRTRTTWAGDGVFAQVAEAIRRLRATGYQSWSVICTATSANLRNLAQVVAFLHREGVPTCMLNPVRCTRPGARTVKPSDADLTKHYLKALERSHALFQETGRKLVVANFANILLAILAPQARRLMCDISPCGGGRAFFALAADGGCFPCSEFVGLPAFNGGILFTDAIDMILASSAFAQVTGRKVEDIAPCTRCAIRHFCGSPCPAEAHEMHGGMNQPGAFCGLYEEQTRYAFRLIADGRAEDFLWDGWDKDTQTTVNIQG